MKKAIVVNCSAPRYNLGANKMADWLRTQGWHVEQSAGDPGVFGYDFDLVCLSVIFSWHASIARDIAKRLKDHSEIWCGGPGMFALGNWWKRETGLETVKGLDARFDRQRGQYLMTFASRGCPVGCYFCIVPRIEGKEFSFDPDFTPAPILCDNNISALPVEYQEHIIARYRETRTVLKDANSGFEPKAFDGGTYARWKPVLRGPWRFAFDEMREHDEVRAMMHILREETKSKKRVYVLIGNEPIGACYERACKVLEWGGEPYCQYILPLHWLGDPASLKHRYDWTYQDGRDFERYYNRFLWRSHPIWEYNNRKGDGPPFVNLRRMIAV